MPERTIFGLRRLARGVVGEQDGGSGAALDATGLSKRFGGLQAVLDVDMHLERGRTVGVIGPNGAGKSTLINLLSGLYRPDRGQIRFAGSDVSRRDLAARSRAGLLRTFQQTKVLRSFLVRDAIELGLSSPRARRGGSGSDVAELADSFGLGAYLGRYVGELPYGTQKVLNLCLIAASRPIVLLLDEPFSGVTASDVEMLSALIRRLRDNGTAIGLVEHDMGALMPLSDRVVVLDAGRVILDASPQAVQASDQVQRIYLGRKPASTRGARG